MNLTVILVWCFTFMAHKAEEKIPFHVFNRSFTSKDIDVHIFIDGQSLLYTPSLNQTLHDDTTYFTTLNPGQHIISVHSYQKSIFTIDTVIVDSTALSTSKPVNWLWIDYNYTPPLSEQFTYELNRRIEFLKPASPLDSTSLWHRARQETI